MQQKDYTKLGGWLLVFAVVQILGLITNLYAVVSNMDTYTNLGLLPASIAPALTIQLIAIIAIIVLTIVMLIMLFTKKRAFKMVFFIRSILDLAASGVIFALLSSSGMLLPQGTASQVGAIVGAAFALIIWGLYLTKSERVKVYVGDVPAEAPVVYPSAPGAYPGAQQPWQPGQQPYGQQPAQPYNAPQPGAAPPQAGQPYTAQQPGVAQPQPGGPAQSAPVAQSYTPPTAQDDTGATPPAGGQ